jgi:hypothetical protein
MGVPSNLSNNLTNEEIAAAQQQNVLNQNYQQQTAQLQSQYAAENAQLNAAINPSTPASANNTATIGAYAGAQSPGSYLGNSATRSSLLGN